MECFTECYELRRYIDVFTSLFLLIINLDYILRKILPLLLLSLLWFILIFLSNYY